MGTLASVPSSNWFSPIDNNEQDWLIPYAAVSGAIGVEVGDLMYDYGSSLDVAYPAGQQASGGSEAADQVTFAAAFVGCSIDKVLSTETNATRRMVVRTAGVKVFDCPSQAWAKGDLIGIYSDGANSPVAQKVDKVTTVDKAIGVVVKGTLGVSVTTVTAYFQAKNYTGQKTAGTTLGDVTLNSIVSGDSSLDISGQTAAQGGSVNLAGGTSSTAGNAGGAITATGGTPGTAGVGGAVTIAAGAGGSASGNGGAASVTGGAGTASNSTGGLAKLVGGAGHGTSNGGAAQVTGGLGGATSGVGGATTLTAGQGGGTGAGGVASMTGGASGTGATGNGGAASVTGGAAASTNGTGGAASVTGGVATGTGTGGALTLAAGASGGAGGTAGAVTINSGAAAGGTAAGVTIQSANAPVAGGGVAAAVLCTSTALLGIYWGTGSPTFAAAKGSLYLKTDAATSATRLFVSSDAVGTWTAFTSAA
jgi:hypothetical protein